MKASDLFVEALENEGVKYIFGVPGEENADMMMSLLDSKIEFIICRHEQGAAFMADVWGRLTGTAGVCLGTLGPGATNLVTGVADANMDRAPCIAITGQADTQRLHKESHQNMDVIGMFKPITKWAQQVLHPDNIPEIVRKGFKRAEAEKPGAVHIELPEDIAKMQTGEVPIPKHKLRRPAPDHKSVAAAVELIKNAKNPLVLAGNGCVRKRASNELKRLVEKTGIFVANTFMGKGAIDCRDDHSLLTVGLGSRDIVIEAFERADLVISVGYDLVEYHPSRWNQKGTPTIHIDFEPAEVDANYRPTCEIVADVAEALWAINEALPSDLSFDPTTFSRIRNRIIEDLDAHETDDAYPMKPQRILSDVRKFLGDDDVLLSDVGAHKMWIARHYNCHAPNTCLISNGFCSMGFAMPGVIAANLAFDGDGRKALAICGDGGAMMNIQDIMTAVQYKIPAVTMVWEDGEYGLIAWKQENGHGKTSHTKFVNPDFVALAEAMGAAGFKVNAADELMPTLEKAFAIKDKPSIILVPVDYSENMKLTKRLGQLVARG
jgi:acetolactate synthase-1/2/3 large subunit